MVADIAKEIAARYTDAEIVELASKTMNLVQRRLASSVKNDRPHDAWLASDDISFVADLLRELQVRNASRLEQSRNM